MTSGGNSFNDFPEKCIDMTIVSLKIGGVSRDGHGIKLAYYLPAHKRGQELKALQALEIERMGQSCFN